MEKEHILKAVDPVALAALFKEHCGPRVVVNKPFKKAKKGRAPLTLVIGGKRCSE